MSTNATAARKSAVTTEAEIDDRTRRALTEYMTVLSEGGDIYTVVGQNAGGEYRVDAREGRCTCPDAEYRLDADEACKHQRRVAFATGEVPIPAGVAPEDVDDQLGEHVDGEVRHVATDGGAVEAGDGAEVLATPETDGPVWEGPFTEYDKYGQPTGHAYVRCRACGVEVLTGSKESAAHRDGCPHDDE